MVLLDMIGFGIVIPILPFITPRLGGSSFDIALIVATYSLCAGVMGPVWGRLSDRIGRKPVLIVCTAGAAVAYVFLGLAQSLWMIYLARAFAGVMAGNFPVASAMMADVTPPAERAKGMGIVGAAFGLGLVLGPVLGGLLAGPEGSFTLPCIVAGVMSVLAVVAAWFFLPESHTGGKSEARQDQKNVWLLLKGSQSRLLMLQFALHTGAIGAITYIFPLWVYARLDWKAQEVGIVFGVVGAIMALNQGLLMGRLVRLLGELRLLRVCISLFLAGVVLSLFADGPVTMVASLILALAGATLCMPVLTAMASRRAAAEQRGRLLGAASASSAVGRVLGPLLAGSLLTLGGFRAAMSVSLLMVMVYWWWAFSPWAKREPRGGA